MITAIAASSLLRLLRPGPTMLSKSSWEFSPDKVRVLSSTRLRAQVCHDCVVVATSVRTELILFHSILTMETVRNLNSDCVLTHKRMNHVISLFRAPSLTSLFLSPSVTVVACLKGYEGVKSTVNRCPVTLLSFSTYVRKHSLKERWR